MRLKLKEPRLNGYTPPAPFGLHNDGVDVHEVFRLLIGSVNLEDQDTSKLIRITKNQLRVGGSRVCRPDQIVSMILENRISLDEYRRLIVDINSRNADFFLKLKKELSLSLYCRAVGRHTESFLYMYRVVEMMSLALPMVYALAKGDFRNTHDFLKGLFSNDRSGDLAALKSSVGTIAREADLVGLKFDLSVSGRDEGVANSMREQLRVCVLPSVARMEIEDEGDVLAKIAFTDMPSFFVTVRNRMFHYKIGESNFDLAGIGGSEVICDICMEQVLFWFTHLYAAIVLILATQIRPE